MPIDFNDQYLISYNVFLLSDIIGITNKKN